jgi:hypothetical protein
LRKCHFQYFKNPLLSDMLSYSRGTTRVGETMTKIINNKLNPAIIVALLVVAIIFYNGSRVGQRHYLLRRALVHPKFSPWRRLLNFADEGSFIEMTGFNFDTFRELVLAVASDDERNCRRQVGRPKLLNIEDEIGLYLFFVNSTMRAKHLAMLFGVLPNTVTTTLRRLMKRIIKAIKNHPAARIQFPDDFKMREYAEMVRNREPSVHDVIGFLDGVALPVQCSDDAQAQSEYYNGYHQDTMINNIFLFSPEGKVLYSVFNAPGSRHDSHVAQPLVAIIIDNTSFYKICVDQDFKRGGSLFDKFVGPISQNTRRN